MNRKIIILVLGLVFLFGCIQNAEVFPDGKCDMIPEQVLDKYEESLNKESVIITFVELYYKDGETIYVVSEGFGYNGYLYYYSADGTYLGESYSSDVPIEDTEPPVNLEGYTREVLYWYPEEPTINAICEE